jgi:hypothetical protein
LGKLGFDANGLHHAGFQSHQTHFHIDLRAPKPVTIEPSHNLLTDQSTSNQTAPLASDAIIDNAQTLLYQVKTDLNFAQGEVLMFIPDMPNVPPQDVPAMIAQANQVQAGDTIKTRTLGVCLPVPNKSYSLSNAISPVSEAGFYLQQYEHREFKVPHRGSVNPSPLGDRVKCTDERL